MRLGPYRTAVPLRREKDAGELSLSSQVHREKATGGHRERAASQKERSHQTQTLPALWSRTSSFQKYKETNFC